MTELPPTDVSIDPADRHTARVRQCLKCKSDFRSQWAGERICSRCKGSKGWRSGLDVHASPVGFRR